MLPSVLQTASDRANGMGGSRGENEHEKRGADAREAVGGVDVSLLRVAVGATVGATIIGRGVRSSIKTLG